MNCSINCKELINGVCPPMLCLCPKKLKEHDAKVRQDAIEEYRKEMHDMIQGNEEFIDWQKHEILECNELVAEQLKGEQND